MPTLETQTIKPAGGGDYTDFVAWEAQNRDLVTEDVDLTVECYSGGDLLGANNNFVILGWVTDATRRILVTVPAAERHDFTSELNTAKAYMALAGSYAQGQCIVQQGFVTFEWLQYDSSTAAYTGGGALPRITADVGTSGAELLIRECIFLDRITGTLQGPIFGAMNNPSDLVLQNVLVVSTGTNPQNHFWQQTNNCNIHCLNCVSIGANISYYFDWRNSVFRCVNCISQDATTGWLADSTGVFSGDWNLTDEALAGQMPGANSLTGTTLTFVDKANHDYHLASGDENSGQDLSADTYPFSIDIDGDTRSSWHIGWDELAAAPGATASDAADATDVATARIVARDAASDIANASDSSVSVVSGAAAADAAVGSDSVSRITLAFSLQDELANVSDTAVANIGSAALGTDAADGSDTASAQLLARATASDVANVADSAVAQRTMRDSAVDAADASDAGTDRLVRRDAGTDAADVSDGATGRLIAADQATDAAVASDSAVPSSAGLVQEIGTDAADASDSATTYAILANAETDQANASDVAAGRRIVAVTASDAAAVSDTASAKVGAIPGVDIGIASDAATAMVIAIERVADAAVASDVPDDVLTLLEAIAEGMVGSDTAAAGTGLKTPVTQETLYGPPLAVRLANHLITILRG